MESSSTSTRFRFRDHSELMEDSTQLDTDSDVSSVSSDLDDDAEPESMAGKGIKHLCSELLELKAASNEDFHRNIFSNYTAFIRIFEEVQSLENEIMQLKNHVSTQKSLVKELADGIYLNFLSDETKDPVIEESKSAEPPSRIDNISETLDILFSENRIEEALNLIELEEERFQEMQFEESCPLEELRCYHTEISERKAILALHLTLVAENPRVTASELQKALVGLCRVGDSNLATQLLLKYYHSRIVTGIHNLQSSKSFLNGAYIRELAKLVFSLIAQAAKGFVMLYGETSPYASELIQWTLEETNVFVSYFEQYVKSISEISGGLSIAVEAVKVSLSFCSLLESQRLVLLPHLIKLIRPCMEEVLHFHMDHFKRVINIFMATDSWELSSYLISGIMDKRYSMVLEEQEYCLLTNSGWKFVTLLQTIAEDVTQLVSLQIEGSVLGGLMNLFTEYILILERAIICETDVAEKGGSRINFAISLRQQISILANLSSTEQLFSSMVKGIFGGVNCMSSNQIKNLPVGNYEKELDSFILAIQEASSQLRIQFCQKFIKRVMSLETTYKFAPGMCRDGQGDSKLFHDVLPSLTLQVFFLELRNLERLAESDVFEKEWLVEILKELIEALFICISNEKEIGDTKEENLTAENSLTYKQFILDLHFIVETAKYGGYFSNNNLFLINLMKSALVSAGLDPERDVYDNRWLLDSITEVIRKLLEIEKATILPNEESHSVLGDETPKDKSTDAADSYQDDIRSFSENSLGANHDLEATSEAEIGSVAETTASDDGNATNAADDETEIVEKTDIAAAVLSVDLVEEACEIGRLPTEDGNSTQVANDMVNFFD
ncbi:exocyst complex component EXO84B [Ziziphus jujuba]|uniref:Exocyst complex component EXO84B n=2 Tax=Ziziphus jujuba TaxID=326968 RepID=A0ABM3IW55_ZIZJJ|nr:exocyst complex component EXO84B [Ziziphus jujuba]KAH7517419.1 hypothetical protein FEM48_Zijuj09G0061500 [Ziziphus jujuba var. spinosa]